MIRRFAIPLAIILPLLYGYALWSISDEHPVLGVISYGVSLVVGGILGVIGCLKLAEPGPSLRVLLAGTLLVFFSETLRGVGIVVDAALHEGDLGSVSVVLFHAGTIMVLMLGSVLFIGSTEWGKARELLTSYIPKLPWKS